MAHSLTFTRGDFVPPVEATEDEPGRPGGWNIKSHSLTHNGNSWSGSLWLEGLDEDATYEDLEAAIQALYDLAW